MRIPEFSFEKVSGQKNVFTWQLTMTGQLTLVPIKALQRVSKSASKGAAELQIGIRLWVNLGYFSFKPSITS